MMKKTSRILTLICGIMFMGQSSFAQVNVMESGMKSIGNTDQSKVAATLLISFIIGNVVAWSMGAYPRDFPIKPYSAEESEMISDLIIEAKENPDESTIKTELGAVYFQHNDLDKAEAILEEAVKQDPENAEALAIYSANEAKQSGAMWDFTWGLMKLHRLDKAVDGVNQAVELEPDNVSVRLYRMNTLVGLENRKGSFHWIFKDEQWFRKQDAEDPTFFPRSVKLEFYNVLAEAYESKARQADKDDEARQSEQTAESYRRLSMQLNQQAE